MYGKALRGTDRADLKEMGVKTMERRFFTTRRNKGPPYFKFELELYRLSEIATCICCCYVLLRFCISGSHAHTKVNPLHPNISMYILHSVLSTFPNKVIRKICIIINSFFSC